MTQQGPTSGERGTQVVPGMGGPSRTGQQPGDVTPPAAGLTPTPDHGPAPGASPGAPAAPAGNPWARNGVRPGATPPDPSLPYDQEADPLVEESVERPAVREPAAAAGAGDRSRVRRARLRTVRVDPWSVMKTAFLLSIAFGIMIVVAVAVVWNVLEAAGVYSSVNSTVSEVLGTNTAAGEFDLYDYIGLRRVLGIATLIAVVDVVLITALATLGAFLYNLSASLLGGVEVTLAEDD